MYNQHNFNKDWLSYLCDLQTLLQSHTSCVGIQQWRYFDGKIGLLCLVWLKLQTSYTAGRIPTFGNNSPV
jgi:hypothetical protein